MLLPFYKGQAQGSVVHDYPNKMSLEVLSQCFFVFKVDFLDDSYSVLWQGVEESVIFPTYVFYCSDRYAPSLHELGHFNIPVLCDPANLQWFIHTKVQQARENMKRKEE